MIKCINKIPSLEDRYAFRQDGLFLPYELIALAFREGWGNSLAVFVALKKCHKNGVFFNASTRSLADQIGYSHNVVAFHLKVLEAKGLVCYRQTKIGRGQLVLKGYKSLTNQHQFKRVVYVKYGTKGEVKAHLSSCIAMNHVKSQEYNLKRKSINRNRKMEETVETVENYASLSDRYLGRILGISNATANRLKKKWVDQGLIKIYPVWQILEGKFTQSDFTKMRELGAIQSHAKYELKTGRIFLRKADGVEISYLEGFKVVLNTEQPLFIKPKAAKAA